MIKNTNPRDAKFKSDSPIFKHSYHIEFKFRFVFITIQKKIKNKKIISEKSNLKKIDMNITLTGKKNM